MKREEIERVSEMQSRYEDRIKRQGRVIGSMTAFLEKRGLLDDYSSFAAQWGVGKDSQALGPTPSPQEKEGN